MGVVVGPGVDTFGGAEGEDKARTYEVLGHPFLARKAGEGKASPQLTPRNVTSIDDRVGPCHSRAV